MWVCVCSLDCCVCVCVCVWCDRWPIPRLLTGISSTMVPSMKCTLQAHTHGWAVTHRRWTDFLAPAKKLGSPLWGKLCLKSVWSWSMCVSVGCYCKCVFMCYLWKWKAGMVAGGGLWEMKAALYRFKIHDDVRTHFIVQTEKNQRCN